MAANEQPPEVLEDRPGFTTTDTVWVGVCFALCGGCAVYLFTPYLFPAVKDSATALLAIALAAAVAFAAVGAALAWKRD